MRPGSKTLVETVRDCLSLLVVLKGSPSNDSLADTSKAFAWVMSRNAVTPQELENATGIALDTLTFFPAPAEMLKIINQQRQERKALESQILLEMGKVGIDKHGAPWLAHEQYIQDGEYIGPIPELGQPIKPELPAGEAPALEMRSDVKAKLEETANKLASLPKPKKRRVIEGETIQIDEAERQRQIGRLREA